ncbi:MAG: hypothetical protein V4674_04310 [Patescibacteria group bacterium]
MNPHQAGFLKEQVLPVLATIVVCAFLVGVLFLEILFLNQFTTTDILLSFRWVDVLVGLTIYLKTSIDFAIFIGHLMHDNAGWKSRLSIEIGTAFGNAAGTFAVLAVWTFFKEVKWLLALMIFLAALVLFKLAEQSLEHAKDEDDRYPNWFRRTVFYFELWLGRFNRLVAPVLKYVVPSISMKSAKRTGFWSLLAFSFTVPFILGLDDFAGYVPLFSVVNVFGFGIGVFVGHMLLNMLLYISPAHTIKVVKNPIISLIGSFVFVGLGIWGISEVAHLIGV